MQYVFFERPDRKFDLHWDTLSMRFSVLYYSLCLLLILVMALLGRANGSLGDTLGKLNPPATKLMHKRWK